MAERLVRQLVDDIDGTEARHTRRFSVDGQNYRLDLSDKNNDLFDKAMKKLIANAKHELEPAKRPSTASGRSTRRKADSAAVRAWAATNDIKVGAHGPIPLDVMAKFHSVHMG